jgi:predicted RNase H-like nuclease (RuvC/YqgF family)
MVDIQMDIVTSLTVLTGLTAVLGFFWKLFEKRKKDTDEKTKEEKFLEDKEKKLECKLSKLEETDKNQEVEIKKLSDECEMLREENTRLKKDFLDNLDRLEVRLEKMLELIISHFKSKDD